MLSADRSCISNVIQQLNSGTVIFQAALDASDSAIAQEVFHCAIKARTFASDYLQKLVAIEDDDALLQHAFGSVLHKLYPDILHRLPEDTNPALLQQLAEEENKTLTAMQSAVDNASSEILKKVLKDLNPRLNGGSDKVIFEKAC